MRRVILVAGPPGAGKSTHVARHAAPTDLVLDQDALGSAAFNAALQRVAGLAAGTAWVIRCSAGPTARQHLAARIRATEVVLLHPSLAELRARASQRPDPRRAHAALMAWERAEAADAPPRQSRARQPKASTTARGYGAPHQAMRESVRPVVEAGDATCWRCGQGIQPGEPWDLGHDDSDPTKRTYRGPEHMRCNRRAGARKGNRKRQQAAPIVRSRRW